MLSLRRVAPASTTVPAAAAAAAAAVPAEEEDGTTLSAKGFSKPFSTTCTHERRQLCACVRVRVRVLCWGCAGGWVQYDGEPECYRVRGVSGSAITHQTHRRMRPTPRRPHTPTLYTHTHSPRTHSLTHSLTRSLMCRAWGGCCHRVAVVPRAVAAAHSRARSFHSHFIQSHAHAHTHTLSH